MAEQIQECFSILNFSAEGKGVSLRSQIEGPLLSFELFSDHKRVLQILLNLTSNAIKYTASGGSVTICLRFDEENAEISITDTGVGIDEENMKELFSAFHKISKNRDKNKYGCGLGL